MTSTQRFLANNRNVFVGAALAASSVSSIENAVLSLPKSRAGSATVAMSGAYTGHEESRYEIEITDNTVSTPLISQPIFAGAGTGTISAIGFTGTAQEFTVKLADLGQVLTAAGTDMEGISIEARIPGAGGNLIHFGVDQSGLVFADTDYSLIRDLKAGADGVTGPEYDWDTKVMGADGQMPAAAHRLTFGDDTSTIYRQYKAYKDGKWAYHFEPVIQSDIPASTRIKFVTGSRTVTLTDGTTTETYTGIVTLYDLLSAIQTTSALVKVVGVVANDRAPNGMAARDLITRTDAHCLPSTGSGSTFAVGFVDCYAEATAATELIEARCWANTSSGSPNAGIGKELWALKGSVSGALGNIQTNVAYALAGKFGLKIPQKLPDGFYTQRGKFTVEDIVYQPRGDGITPVPICVSAMALGPEAVDQKITLKYTKRPDGACDCKDMPVPDLSKAFCLTGIPGDLTIMGYTAATVTRLTAMYDWGADIVAANSAYYAGLASPEFFIEDLRKALAKFEETLALVEDVAAGPLAWDAAFVEFQADVTQNLGTLNDAADFTAPVGETIDTDPRKIPLIRSHIETDANGTLIAVTTNYMDPIKRGDYVFTQFGEAYKTHIVKEAEGYALNSPSVATPARAATWFNPDGTAFTGTIPAYPASQQGCFDAYGTPYTGDHYIVFPNMTPGGAKYGINGSYVPDGFFLVDGTPFILGDAGAAAVTGTDVSIRPIGGALVNDRHLSRLDWVLISAGISPLGKTDAGTVDGGDGCWRDCGDPYYWTVVGSVKGKYGLACTNSPYFSSQEVPCCDGAYRATHEFAFQINVVCEYSLLEGDTVTLSIGNAGWDSTYQVGDTLYLPVIAASDLYLAGGKDGDNIQTWHVDGSVDGAFPAYALDLDTPVPYSQSGLGFTLTPGGIPFEAGDLFKFTIEGGHYRWRKDSGTWSTPAAVGASLLAISDGLSAQFSTGAAPSFATGDLYQFRALQPAALSHAVTPDPDSWQWTGATSTLTANLGTAHAIDAFALGFHTLPSGATVTLWGGADGAIWDWSEAITWRSGVMAKLFASKTATWLKIVIASATGGAIGWAWAGAALSTENSAECMLRRDYSVERGSGLNPSAAFLGATRSGDIEWQQGVLKDADMTGLLAMLDHLKTNDDEPLILIPQSTRPEEAYPVRVVMDEIDMPEDGGYQPNTGNERRYGLKLTVKGVVA